MRKPSGARLAHGTTTALVVAGLLELSARQGQAWVSRAQLMQVLKLPKTTVDDRLRVLVKRGQVQRLLVKGKRPGKYRIVVPQPPPAAPAIEPAPRERHVLHQNGTTIATVVDGSSVEINISGGKVASIYQMVEIAGFPHEKKKLIP